MFMNLSKDWLWCQYTPGAGGKLICAILQLSQKVHPWHNDISENFQSYIDCKFMIEPSTHLKNETVPPYSLDWYTRQLPFTRGDNIASKNVDSLWTEKNDTYLQYLTMHWCKPYFPNWFCGRAIRIVNDPGSMDFLRKRRDAIFYEWRDNKVFFKRFLPAHIVNKHLVKKFQDDPIPYKEYENKLDFYEEEFYKNVEVMRLQSPSTELPVKHNINLSDLLVQSGSKIATVLNSVFDLDIDLKKADILVDAWQSNNRQFID
jgi:hypothetical protein